MTPIHEPGQMPELKPCPLPDLPFGWHVSWMGFVDGQWTCQIKRHDDDLEYISSTTFVSRVRYTMEDAYLSCLEALQRDGYSFVNTRPAPAKIVIDRDSINIPERAADKYIWRSGDGINTARGVRTREWIKEAFIVGYATAKQIIPPDGLLSVLSKYEKAKKQAPNLKPVLDGNDVAVLYEAAALIAAQVKGD